MSGKSLFLYGAFACATLSVASAKSYDIVLDAPSKAGDSQLKPGEYKVKIEGSQAVFTDEKNAQAASVPVQVESSGKKFPYTSVETSNQDGVNRIQAIDLGDSTTRVKLPPR
jgi:hypothetical protein